MSKLDDRGDARVWLYKQIRVWSTRVTYNYIYTHIIHKTRLWDDMPSFQYLIPLHIIISS